MPAECTKHTIAGPMLALNIKNLGPIKNGDIALKPLTVLLGPNNSGKSHVAKLIHSVIKCETMVGTPRFLPYDPPLNIKESIRRIGKDVDDGRISNSDVVADLMHLYMSDFFPGVLLNNLSAAEWNDIVRHGAESFSIEIHSGIINSTVRGTDKPAVADTTAPPMRVYPSAQAPDSPDYPYLIDRDKNELGCVQIPGISYSRRPENMMGMLGGFFEYYAMRNTFRDSIYLPSERAGLMDMYKSVLYGMLNTTLPNESNVRSMASEFVGRTLFPGDKPGPFSSMVDAMEYTITGGKINMIRDPRGHVSDIRHEHGGKNTPIHAASSSIKAIAPLALQLKYGITERDMLILEEPETNLDLKNQTNIARLVASLVCSGLSIVVTTHSTYFVDQLSNCLRSGMLYSAGHDHNVMGRDESISKDDIVVYQFVQSAATDGYVIRPTILTEADGIVAPEFVRTDDVLYDELLTLDQQHNGVVDNGRAWQD